MGAATGKVARRLFEAPIARGDDKVVTSFNAQSNARAARANRHTDSMRLRRGHVNLANIVTSVRID